MRKKVLYISYDGMTDPLGQSQVIPYLKGLSVEGHLIIIVSAEKPERFNLMSEMLRKELVQCEIGWYPVAYSNDLPVWSSYQTYRRLHMKSLALEQEYSFDIVHCRSYIAALIGLALKRSRGTKFIFDMRGFWADERLEGNIWNLRNPFYRKAYYFFKKKEQQFLSESDVIISLTENAKAEILTWGIPAIRPEKIVVIPCCTDLDFFSQKKIDEVKQDGLRQKLKIDHNEFVLNYSGSLGTWYLLEEMMYFFSILLEERPDSKFHFITNDKKEVILRAASHARVSESRILVTSATRQDMPLLLSLGNASVFFIRNSFSKKASSPTKLGELMSMGIPIVCNKGVGDINHIISSETGIVVDSFEEHALREASKRLVTFPFEKEKIRQTAEAFFSLDNGILKYDTIYDAV